MATILDYLNKKANVLHSSGKNVFIECPGCGTRKTKCAVQVEKAFGNCFRASCPLNGGFSFVTLITRLESVSYSEALGIAAGYQDEVILEYKAKSYGTNRLYPRNSLPIQEFLNYAEKLDNKLFFSLAKHGVYYLANRGLDQKKIEDFKLGIGYENFSINEKVVPRYGMIIIPIIFNSQIVSYVERSIEASGVSLGPTRHYKPTEAEDYLTSSQILFNCDVAIPKARKTGILPIVEDVWSAIKLDAVATMDGNISEEQLFILTNNYQGAVASVRDNDRGGRDASRKDVMKLSKYYEDVRVVTCRGIDPDDYLEDTKQKIIDSKPIDLFEMKLNGVFK